MCGHIFMDGTQEVACILKQPCPRHEVGGELCKCGHPKRAHTGSWEQTGLAWDDRVRHEGGCSVGWIDESDVGMTCTCKEFRDG